MALADSEPFSGFAVDDLAAAREFYGTTLGLRVSDVPGNRGLMRLNLAGGRDVLVYQKPDHAPASYTILNFPVQDVGAEVDELASHGVVFQRYDGMPQDAAGVMRGNGPDIAWFTDPAGNILSVVAQD